MEKYYLGDNNRLNVLLLTEFADNKGQKNALFDILNRYEEDGNYNVSYATAYVINVDNMHERLVQLSEFSSKFDLVVGYGYGGAITIALQKFCAVPYMIINPVFTNTAFTNNARYSENFKFFLDKYLNFEEDLDDTNGYESNCLLVSKDDIKDVRQIIEHYSKNPVKEVISLMKRKREQLIYDTLMDMLYKIRIKKTNFFI